MERIALYNDSFQNWKTHDIQKAQLILTDIPYQLGKNMYGSNPVWYKGGTIQMVKVNLRESRLLIQIQRRGLEFLNSSTSALTY